MNDGLIQDGAEVGGAFPSLVESDPSESTAATWQREARELLRLAMDRMSRLSKQATPQRSGLRTHLANLQLAHDYLEHLEDGLDDGRTPSKSLHLDMAQRQEIARTVRDRRMTLGLSVQALAQRVGLSEGTIKNLESPRKPITRTTLLRLTAMAELGFQFDELLFDQPMGDQPEPMNCFIAPGFNPIKMVIELGEKLNSAGGVVEQTNVYLDHQSAAAYLKLANQPEYVAAFRDPVPMTRVAEVILESTGRAGLDVIALGSGDAREEVRLVQHLLAKSRLPDLRLYLLDVSQPLLLTGFVHAAETLADQYGVAYFAMQGNFHHLPRYTQLNYTPTRSHRRRIATIFGGTMASLEHEGQFFRHSLSGLAPGDLAVIYAQLAAASPAQPDAISRLEPALQKPISTAHKNWLTDPIYRYCKEVTDVELHLEINTTCPVPGSYALEAIATVKLTGRRQKVFSMHRWRKYDPDLLSAHLGTMGWETLAQLPCGSSPKNQAAVLVLRKRSG
jgi:transcriptional regulator with XRE-family HTH domain